MGIKAPTPLKGPYDSTIEMRSDDDNIKAPRKF